MDTRAAIKAGINGGQSVVDKYLADLSDTELLARAIPGTNHIAWQLGHTILAEHDMIEALKPKTMPRLPAGFREKHSNATAASDDPKAFFTKAEYLETLQQQRAATLALLDTLSDDDLEQESPESLRKFVKTVGHVFVMQGTHWVMHAGQWAIVRRKLGRPPLF